METLAFPGSATPLPRQLSPPCRAYATPLAICHRGMREQVTRTPGVPDATRWYVNHCGPGSLSRR